MLPYTISRVFRLGKKSKAQKKKVSALNLFSKRQKFVLAVLLLSFGLFISEYLFSSYAVVMPFLLAFLTDILLLGSVYEDLQENFSFHPLVLPFLCSLAFGLFYFLAPARLISRLILTSLYALGLYSLFLSENIFIVASIRTIALLHSARIVTFVITLISYFFLTNIIFSLRLGFIPTIIMYFLFTALFIYHALWSHTLEKSFKVHGIWIGILSLCLMEVASILWFWPTSPTVLSVFLSGMFYILLGLTNIWLDRRLFKNVIWEYVWVGVFSCVLLLWFTSWQG